jgi:anthranilate synthase component 1
MAYVQAGAGLVADSVPETEYTETVNKARALLTALEMAHSGFDPAAGGHAKAKRRRAK